MKSDALERLNKTRRERMKPRLDPVGDLIRERWEAPRDYADDEHLPMEAQPMFTLVEKLFLAAMTAVGLIGIWIAWPS